MTGGVSREDRKGSEEKRHRRGETRNEGGHEEKKRRAREERNRNLVSAFGPCPQPHSHQLRQVKRRVFIQVEGLVSSF